MGAGHEHAPLARRGGGLGAGETERSQTTTLEIILHFTYIITHTPSHTSIKRDFLKKLALFGQQHNKQAEVS